MDRCADHLDGKKIQNCKRVVCSKTRCATSSCNCTNKTLTRGISPESKEKQNCMFLRKRTEPIVTYVALSELVTDQNLISDQRLAILSVL